jgi:hypothetical protein
MSPRSGFALILLFLLVGCHKVVPLQPSGPEGTSSGTRPGPEGAVDDLTARVRALLRKENELVWRNWTEGTPLDLSVTDAEHGTLYTRDALLRIDAALRRAKGGDASRALEILRAHFASELVAESTKVEQENLDAQKATARFEADGQMLQLRDLERLLAREGNALTRQSLHHAATAAIRSLEPATKQLTLARQVAATQADFPSQLELAAALRRTRPERLASMADQFLSGTEQTFRGMLETLAARELRLPLERVRARDLPRMFRSRDVDELFPAGELPTRGLETARAMGLEVDQRVRFDNRDLPRKHPRPLALVFEVPTDVRLSWKPASGVHAQAGYLHELGFAMHAAHTQQTSLPLSVLGGSTLSNAYSGLFAGLTETPSWLEQNAGLSGDRLQRYLEASAAWDLYLLRQMAGRLLFSISVMSGKADDEARRYGEIMSRALEVPFEEDDLARGIVDVDETLASAAALESAFLMHQLRVQLETRFGMDWWREREAGTWLKGLWAEGTALDVDEIAQRTGAQGLAPDALIQWIDRKP